MSREIMIIAKNKDGVISNNIVKIGDNGQPIVIKGTKDTFYEIKDMATNRAPDQIYTKRFKNDLKLKINPKGGALDGAGEADVVIQDYCANGNCEIVGVHETGEYYQYVPQSGDAALSTTELADGEFAYQSLGTIESSSWGPASLLPLAGLGGLGGGGGSKADTTAPTAVPTIDAINDDVAPVIGVVAKGGHTNDTTPTLSGTLTEALGSGEVVAVYRDGVKVGNATVDASGTGWTFEDTGVTDGEHIYTTRAEDAAGNKGTESAPYNIIVDTVVPDAASVTMVTDDYNQTTLAVWGNDDDKGSWSIDSAGTITIIGNVNVTSDGKIITNDSTPTLSGTGEAGTTVRVYDGNIDPTDPTVNLVGETTVASDGTWTLTTSELQAEEYQKPGTEDSGAQHVEHTLNITLTDAAGNISDPASIDMIVDTLHTYNLGSLTFTNEDTDLYRERLDQRTSLESGDNHYFTGAFTISDDLVAEIGGGETQHIPYQEGDEVYITLTNKETGEEYLVGGPNNPTTIVDGDGKWSITINPEQLYYNKTTDAMETLPNGNYENQVIVREASGDISVYYTSGPSATYGDFGIDTVAPDKPVINQDLGGTTTDQSFRIDVNSMDAISYYEFVPDYFFGDVKELLFYRDGSTDPVGSGTVSIDGTATTTWTDSDSLDAEGVYMYQVKAVDVAGNESELSDKAWVIFDSNNDHDLTNADVAGKDFNEMMLVGNNVGEVFTLDNVNFVSIDAREGLDTFTLLDNSGALNVTQLDGFEVFNIGNNTFNIGAETIESDYASRDFILIKGDGGTVNLDNTSWSQTTDDLSYNGGVYDVYTNSNGGDPLYIQVDIGVHLV
ncbi:MAG: Ig-like domain-containing protein [Sulfurovaceae bacterium]|nr:Ig-like domain-containing protein [Sulfurovaceae bacterium]